MAILQKEALEYQRALFELPRFLFTGITIFSTAASFLVKDKIQIPGKGILFGSFFVLGMVLTFIAFIFAYSVVAHTVYAMKRSNNNSEAEDAVDGILGGVYTKLSWFGAISVIYWLFFIILVIIT